MARRLALVLTVMLVWALFGALTGTTSVAGAYEFWTRVRTSGEAYELRGFRVIGGELAITRRRFTQSLVLVIHDLGDLARARVRAGRRASDGAVVSWHSYLRLDQDFGTFITGRLPAGPTRRQDALDLIPEVGESTYALDLLYGHLSIEGLLGGRLEFQLGRIAAIDGTGSVPLDGLAVRAVVAAHVEILASGGLAVRAGSPLGVASYELDGTPGAGCREYVEAAAGQAGRWLLIDRSRTLVDRRFASDFEYCPQRQVVMPTAQLALATRRLGRWHGELGYRIARSPTVGVIGPVDRLATPDLGLYPNDAGQAPGWGTNLEQLYATGDGQRRWHGVTIKPQALLRASLVQRALDRAELAAAVQLGRHTWTPSVARFVPTFDADSIWNAFAVEPSLDLALDYQYSGAWQAQASTWVRRYDGDGAWAYGGTAEVAHRLSEAMQLDTRTIADAGYGGTRLGVGGDLGWRIGRSRVVGRAAMAWVRGDDIASGAAKRGAVTTGTAAATWSMRFASGVAIHSMMELQLAATGELATRALALVDFALESGR
jgi:hypothetical protein